MPRESLQPVLTCLRCAISSILVLSIFSLPLVAQENVSISKPEISLNSGILKITYSIENCRPSQTYQVSLLVTDSNGGPVVPVNIAGDIGVVKCGGNKSITWNLLRDKVIADEVFEFEIMATPVNPTASPGTGYNRNGRGQIIGSSLLVPGLGQKKASGKGVHLVFTPLVYGAAGASAAMYLKKESLVRQYNKLVDEGGTVEEIDDVFTRSERAHNTSTSFMIAAAGAMAVNLVWSAVIPVKQDRTKPVATFSVTPGTNISLLMRASINF